MREALRTARLLLRCWRPGDAALLKDAIDSSLPELQAWLPWALHEPSPLAAIEQRLASFRQTFLAGSEWIFGLFDTAETRVLGGAGLHPRIGPDGLEIGYWIRTAATGAGLATEAARALTAAAFAHTAVSRVEIRCDPDNRRSAAVPQRLGYRLTARHHGNATAPHGAPRDTLVWTMTRADFEAKQSV